MNKYVSKLFGVMFRSGQTQPTVHSQRQLPFKSSAEWRKHWQVCGQIWRTEAEIDAKRQEDLRTCRAITPDIEKGIYPFKEMKLSRADIEWLLATHENGRGPVDWSDASQRKRVGLDMRGADLRLVDLSNLPLSCLHGAVSWKEYPDLTEEQRAQAAVHLEGADLKRAHLEGALLAGARLEKADLRETHMEHAYLIRAHLEGAYLSKTHLEKTNFIAAYLEDAYLGDAILGDEKCVGPMIVDAQWGNVNLAVVDWTQVKVLGDEYKARQATLSGRRKDVQGLYKRAVRANRQLSSALQEQGLNEDAARFAYRAQVLQRKVLWKQRDVGKWFFSLLLALLAGYGYRMWRIVAAYLIVVSVCALAYFVLGLCFTPHLSLMQAFLESVTAFHGRVFLEVFSFETPQIWVTAAEAVLGLLIEGVFIAMLTQRFFGK